MGMYDVQPTLGNMFGFSNVYALGHDIFSVADNEENVHGVMHLYSVNPVQILFLLCDFHKKYILCVLKLAAVSASHCTLVIKAILTNLFTKTLYISNIELYLANF